MAGRDRERGFWLGAYLLFVIVVSAVRALSALYVAGSAPGGDPKSSAGWVFVMSSVGLAAGLAAWNWKRWGVRVLFVLYGVGALSGLVNGRDDAERLMSMVAAMVGAAILAALTRGRMEDFEGVDVAPTEGSNGERAASRPSSKEGPKECPKCGLLSPPNAQRCQCGHVFGIQKPPQAKAPAAAPARTDELPARATSPVPSMTCPCGASNRPEARFCKACGADLRKPLCPNCGTKHGSDARFCDDCGAELKTALVSASQG
jgi:hypothetical protein